MNEIFSAITRGDIYILNSIRDTAACPALDAAFGGITQLGVVTALWICVGLMMAVSKRYRTYGIIMLFALAIGTDLGVYIIKPLVCRIRPYLTAGVTTRILPPGGYSFPSGHTLSSTASAFCVYHANKKAGLLATVTAVIIAYSRLYFYFHYPTDILGGFLIGAGTAAALIRLGLPHRKSGISEKFYTK